MLGYCQLEFLLYIIYIYTIFSSSTWCLATRPAGILFSFTLGRSLGQCDLCMFVHSWHSIDPGMLRLVSPWDRMGEQQTIAQIHQQGQELNSLLEVTASSIPYKTLHLPSCRSPLYAGGQPQCDASGEYGQAVANSGIAVSSASDCWCQAILG